MSVFKNFSDEKIEELYGEWEMLTEEFSVLCGFEEFLDIIWSESPFNPKSENYGKFIPKMKYNFENLLTIPRNSGLPTVACRCWWASRVNYHYSKDHKDRLKKWYRSNKTGEMMGRHYKCFRY